MYDSAEQLEDMWGEEEGAMEEEGEEVEIWEMDQDGHWVEGSPDDEDEWESADEDDPDEAREDAVEQVVDWFGKYLIPAPASAPAGLPAREPEPEPAPEPVPAPAPPPKAKEDSGAAPAP